jgi:hypothetical protein
MGLRPLVGVAGYAGDEEPEIAGETQHQYQPRPPGPNPSPARVVDEHGSSGHALVNVGDLDVVTTSSVPGRRFAPSGLIFPPAMGLAATARPG